MAWSYDNVTKVYTVAYSELQDLLATLSENTVDTPYKLNITGMTANNINYNPQIHTSDLLYRLGYIKYFDLSFTTLPIVEKLIWSFAVGNGQNYEQTGVVPSLIKAPKIPEGVKTLNTTFCGCEKLKTVTLPTSIISVSHCFAKCNNLERIIVPNETVRNIVKADLLADQQAGYFPSTKNIEELLVYPVDPYEDSVYILKNKNDVGIERIDLYNSKEKLINGKELTMLETEQVSFSGVNTDNNLIKVATHSDFYNGRLFFVAKQKNNQRPTMRLVYDAQGNAVFSFKTVLIVTDENTLYTKPVIIKKESISIPIKVNNGATIEITEQNIKDFIDTVIDYRQNIPSETALEYYDKNIVKLLYGLTIEDVCIFKSGKYISVGWLSIFFTAYKRYCEFTRGSTVNITLATNTHTAITLYIGTNTLKINFNATLSMRVEQLYGDWRFTLVNDYQSGLYTNTLVKKEDVRIKFTLHFQQTSATESYDWDYESFQYWQSRYPSTYALGDFRIGYAETWLRAWSEIVDAWIKNTVPSFGVTVTSIDLVEFEIGVPLNKSSTSTRTVVSTGNNPALTMINSFNEKKAEFYLRTMAEDSYGTYEPFAVCFLTNTVAVFKDGAKYYAQTVNSELADYVNKKGSGTAIKMIVGNEPVYLARTAGSNESPFKRAVDTENVICRLDASGSASIPANAWGDKGGVIFVCSGKGSDVSGARGGNGYVIRFEVPPNMKEDITVTVQLSTKATSNGANGGTASRRRAYCEGQSPYIYCKYTTAYGGGSSGGAGGKNIVANITLNNGQAFQFTAYGGGGAGGYGGYCEGYSSCGYETASTQCTARNWGGSSANGGQGGLTGAGTGTRNNPSGRTGGAGLSYNTNDLDGVYEEWVSNACLIAYKYL